jgi:glycosyltransferase involved in cell wall biosynthesis
MLTVIIPTRESERPLVRTLAALVPGAAAGVIREVIVTDAGSSDATAEVADIAGCQFVVSDQPLAARLTAAAAMARSAWLMFLQPGTVPDATWIDEVARFIDGEQARDPDVSRAAAFRPAPASGAARPALLEAFSLMRLALGGRPKPQHGLIVARHVYDAMSGHRDHADPEADLMRRLGRRRIVMLRSGAAQLS